MNISGITMHLRLFLLTLALGGGMVWKTIIRAGGAMVMAVP